MCELELVVLCVVTCVCDSSAKYNKESSVKKKRKAVKRKCESLTKDAAAAASSAVPGTSLGRKKVCVFMFLLAFNFAAAFVTFSSQCLGLS